jgi:hypothetical protein
MFPVICRRKGSGERGVSGEVPVPERGPWGAWASGTLRDKETSFCRSPGLGTALGSECPAEPRPFSQSGASISKGGRSVGTRARCSQRKADSIRLFPVSFISARCQRPTSGQPAAGSCHGQHDNEHDGHDLRVLEVMCSTVLPPALLSLSAKIETDFNISHMP